MIDEFDSETLDLINAIENSLDEEDKLLLEEQEKENIRNQIIEDRMERF